MGISFYTFMAVGYLVDVYAENIREKRAFLCANDTTFLPSGGSRDYQPFNDVSEDMWADHKFDRKTVSFGLQRILWGFFKKLVIADRILTAVNTIIHDPATYDGIYVFLGMMFYALELYADFTGGIDITIGTAELFGIHLKRTRNPYFSKNIAEYWRRWHITMGTWFGLYFLSDLRVGSDVKGSINSRESISASTLESACRSTQPAPSYGLRRESGMGRPGTLLSGE